MENPPFAKSFCDLVVYQKQRALALAIFRRSKLFPPEERYALTDQVRRASRSIGAQIAESWAKRRFEKHFIAKLTDADAECHETEHWLKSAKDCEYLSEEECRSLVSQCEEIGRMLGSMIENACKFCPQTSMIREDPTDLCLLPSDL